ncbi:hypothetical protein DWZ99_12170 [Odoribacter splanchnicus]|uniref:Uncharacterized protein n=2 Tax=Odoribacter splanchnicus TaxID=28118 RepID=A0A413IG03_9BACT|nr:hypothetical protein DXA53_03210 [Odoribacter splanchnicus]RHL82618.1 hypothetical protein DWZ99_12170 [Odoribacter splanchnicus]
MQAGQARRFLCLKIAKIYVMEKKTTAPTVAEQKQEFLLPKSANVFKSELLRAVREIFSIANRIRIQSAILTDDDLRPYTKEFNGSIQEFTDEMNVCASCLMSAYTSLEKMDVRNTSVFLLEKEESHV